MNPDTDTSNTLSKLYQELEQKLQQQLDEIEQRFQSRAKNLEQEKQRAYQARINHLRQGHDNRLRQLRLKSMRDTQTLQQQRFWRCQQNCIDEILADTRHLLEQQQPDRNYLEDWIEQAAPSLTAASAWHLNTSLQWSKRINLEEVALGRSDLKISSTSPVPMLGGAILQNKEFHIEIDGSWDQRLHALIPELWQRWLKDVGTNDQD
ncbi:hypothetical protein [Amphritea balenae]|uniref:ATPase n=1 Tax=Amphritea balenae TaxID=452629 RepID=A0A3P1SWC6_9GAMM|nr:hypothetical protein [Amphritea balenae]RRD01504.1 hypothetical protein EHS89_02800 [Amphritea balenae]GGK56496.1 hypothetical protein GCM10007941_03330 [Amphritea balenae]